LKSSTRQLLLCLIVAIACAIVFPGATYAEGCSSVGFKDGSFINLEATPFGMAVADFNGDGHLDVAVSPNNGSNEVLVLLGRGGSEKFGPPVSFPAGGLPQRMAVGDFNGDGKPDLAVSLDSTSSPGHLAILLNDGTGKFGAPNLVTLSGAPIQPVVADVNNDGKLDIVTALSTGTTDAMVAVLLGNGTGGFTQAANSPFATFSFVELTVIADFNEDGKSDLALPGVSGGVDVMPGDGSGQFGPKIHSAGGGSQLLEKGDFNGDGHLDLLSDNQVLLGTGTGAFNAPIAVPLPADTTAAITGDVNNDGHVDAVVGGPAGITIMLGNGTGNLTLGKSYVSGPPLFGAGGEFAALGDVNEDGKKDVLAVQASGIVILDGDGTGAFNDALSYHTSIVTPRYVLVADFNNDGKKDFATASFNNVGLNSSGIEVALGNGNGGFTKKSVINFGTSAPAVLAAADFNNDGKLDLAATLPASGTVAILLNDGTGGFTADGFSAPSFFVGLQTSSIKAGDFNNDGQTDLIVMAPMASRLFVLLGNGAGSFTVAISTSVQSTASFADDLAVADFDGNGKADVAVIRSGDQLVNVLLGDGTGQFSSTALLPVSGVPVSVLARDLNADGKPDIAVINTSNATLTQQSNVTVFLNNGGAAFNAGTSYPTDGAGVLDVGDFNNDGHPDLAISGGGVTVTSNLNGIAILTNKGNGDFNTSVNVSVGQLSTNLAVGDFNNDGRDDVLVSEFGGNALALLLNTVAPAQPCISLNDVSVTENDSGTVNATFTVTLSSASAQTVKVNYFVVPASLNSGASPATKGVDFDNVSGTVTFTPGQTTQTVNVPVRGDLIDEFDQFFDLSLTTPINAVISDNRGLGTIVDNDPPATLSINDASVTEGNSIFSPPVAVFTVSLNTPSEKPISVQYAVQPGTATADTDYSNTSGTLDFQPGTISRTISVGISPDIVFEPDETFTVNLSNPTNATIADGSGQGTILNDDPKPSITIGGAFRNEGAAGTSGNALFTVTLSNPSSQTITVAYATADVNATAGVDYTATSGTLTFSPSETLKTIPVPVLGDNIDEVNETFVVNLTNPTNATISTAQANGIIQDDDGPTISIGSASVTEGNFGTTNAVFTVTLSAPSVQDVFVNYSTTGDTATSNVDFQRVFSNTLVIPAGSTSATITIRVIGDFIIEPDEKFFVNLSLPANATIAVGQGTGTILNDDSNGKLQFSSQVLSVNENAGTAVISVNRLNGATDTVTVDFATSNGTATAGSDYTATSGTLTFNQGETSKTFSVPIISDNVLEGDETINLTLSNPTGGAVLGVPTAVLTIKNPQLFLALEESGPSLTEVAAVDAIFFTRDPFPLIPSFKLGTVADPNTRVMVFVTGLQLAPGDVSSSVTVNLVDSNGQSHDVPAEDVRLIAVDDFAQVKFRLPDGLAAGVCNVKVRLHYQEGNVGRIRIAN
jgi:hypothetical protein